MAEHEIEVESSEQFATFRQRIRPENQESVSSTIAALLEVYRANHLTGTATININMGGVRSLVYDQVARIPPESAADEAIEELFARQSSSAANRTKIKSLTESAT